MRAIRSLAAPFLILVVACGGASSDPSPSETIAPASSAFSVTDALQSDGPLRGIAFTGQFDREDRIVRPTLAFTTDDTEVTAVIGLGDVVDEGSTVVVTWYRVAGLEQREALFSHEIVVGPGGRAFSQAVAPNGLAPGIYDTVATLDGHIVHTPWVAREGEGSETASATAQPASGDGAGSVPGWDLPGPGDSGWHDDSEPPPQGTPSDTCQVDGIYVGFRPLRDVQVYASWLGPCTTGTLTATVSGPPTTFASSDSLQPPAPTLRGQADVCSLSGGTDLPGTVVHIEATGSASASEAFTLPDFGEGLIADLEGIPPAGGAVEPGDRIKLHAIAFLMAPALGVKTLYVDDGTNLIEAVGNLSGSDQPVPCDPRRHKAELVTEYIVPADAPPIIKLCATGIGFDGTESKNCISYYTAEVWEGTATIASSAAYPGGSVTCQDGWALAFTFGVTPEGTIEGTGTGALTSGPTCPFPMGPSLQRVEYQVLGEKTAGGFSIRFALGTFGPADGAEYAGFFSMFGLPAPPSGGPPVEIAVSGTSGTGQGTWQFQSGNPPATYSANGTITIECVASCEPAP